MKKVLLPRSKVLSNGKACAYNTIVSLLFISFYFYNYIEEKRAMIRRVFN